MPHPAETAREKLLKAAAVLFYENGIAGTGIDAIIARAGVAKKSLYNNFASKADLVHQYLTIRHAELLDFYEERLATAVTPREKVLAVFDAYQDHAEFAYERGFRGCGLLNAAAELTVGDIGRDAVRRHKEEVEGLIATHLAEFFHGDAERAKVLARQLAFLLEGSITRAGLEGNGTLVLEARKMTSDMLGRL
ncbi:AcrR family transcriptional regulator [Neorhizobium huautlense]|uniref:AcrR family transcriptional regulator n=1 Tax=Neorhizobium huautlense TaxID=67774 RepID=A0ABT9PV54_9HYPH|nr:TetR/AcrR family transcriptional regulator [Neorhizobium huautlense]MDP9838349.1 AcrR family transcriptional regulator [Neorhizobium huautlense]